MQNDALSLHEHARSSFRKGLKGQFYAFLHWIKHIEFSGRYPLVFALSMLVGSAWYFSLWHEPQTVWISLAALLGTAAFFLARRFARTSIIFALAIAVFGVSFGAGAGKVATLKSSHVVVPNAIGPVMIEGWVEDVEPAKRGVRLRLLVHAIDGFGDADTPRHIRLTHTTQLKVEAGRFVRCWGVLRPPPAPVIRGDYAFDRQAWYEGLGGVGYVQGRCRGGTLGAPLGLRNQFSLWVAKQRRGLAHYVNSVAGERAGGFAAALTSGDRSFMRAADQEALRGSGLAHLLAISGLHMGIVGGLVYLMVCRGLALIEPLALRFTVRKPAAMVALLASAAYLIISGASVSTQRAFIMALVLFGAVIFDRAALSLRSLSIAMIAVIAIAPWSVLTPGFQMSFAATAALIASYEAWQRQQKKSPNVKRNGVSFWIKSLVVTSTVSSLATMPFALFHFDRIAAMGLIANLLAMPIVSLMSAPFAGAAMVLAPFGLSQYPLRGFGASLEAVLWVAHTFSNAEQASQSTGRAMPGLSLVLLSAALIMACVFRGVRARLVPSGLAAAFGAIVWMSSSTAALHWSPSGEVFLVDKSGGVERISFLDGDALAPLRFSDVLVSQSCSSNICTYEVGASTVVLIADVRSCNQLPDADIILAGEIIECKQKDAVILNWSEVKSHNGVSMQLNRSNMTKLSKPPCDGRPWRQCPS